MSAPICRGPYYSEEAGIPAMKILLATDCYRFQTNGITSVVLSLEDGLRKLGCEVRVLALSDSRKSFRDGDAFFIGSHLVNKKQEHRVSFAWHDPLLKELAAWRPDLIHIHTEGTIAWMAKKIAKKTGAPVVMTTHTDIEYFFFGRFRNSAPVKALCRLFGRITYRQAEKIIVPAEKSKSFPHLTPYPDKIVVIPNGIRLDLFRHPAAPEARTALFASSGLTDNGHTLVTVTRLSKEKNLIEILRFFPSLLRKVPDAQLLVVGDGANRNRLETWCSQNGLSAHVRFTGMVSFEETCQYYHMGDIYVSASMFEVNSISYLEAMASGLPLVCREDASLRGVLEDGVNGRIFRNEQEFVSAVSDILGSESLRESMRAAALARAEEFGIGRLTERTLELYRSVCAARAGKAAPAPKEKSVHR